jgi:hypothetical protein
MIFTEVGASIESQKMAFQCRKFSPLRPYQEKTLGKLVYPVKLSIFGIAVIEEELRPKQPRLKESSALNQFDEIRGEAIKALSVKPIPDKTVKPATGTHKANFLYTKDYTFAEIEIGTRSLMQRKN